jgi:hypothetical protein
VFFIQRVPTQLAALLVRVILDILAHQQSVVRISMNVACPLTTVIRMQLVPIRLAVSRVIVTLAMLVLAPPVLITMNVHSRLTIVQPRRRRVQTQQGALVVHVIWDMQVQALHVLTTTSVL